METIINSYVAKPSWPQAQLSCQPEIFMLLFEISIVHLVPDQIWMLREFDIPEKEFNILDTKFMTMLIYNNTIQRYYKKYTYLLIYKQCHSSKTSRSQYILYINCF